MALKLQIDVLLCCMVAVAMCQRSGVGDVLLRDSWSPGLEEQADFANAQRNQVAGFLQGYADPTDLDFITALRGHKGSPVKSSVSVEVDKAKVDDSVLNAYGRSSFLDVFDGNDFGENRLENTLELFSEQSSESNNARSLVPSPSLYGTSIVRDVAVPSLAKPGFPARPTVLSPTQRLLALAAGYSPQLPRKPLFPGVARSPLSLWQLLNSENAKEVTTSSDILGPVETVIKDVRKPVLPFLNKLYEESILDKPSKVSSFIRRLDGSLLLTEHNARHYLTDLMLQLVQFCKCRHSLTTIKEIRGGVLTSLLDTMCHSAKLYLSGVQLYGEVALSKPITSII